MVRKLFKNVLLFDGTGTPSYPGEALIHGIGTELVASSRHRCVAGYRIPHPLDQSVREQIRSVGKRRVQSSRTSCR
jgi:hypothetical protein